MASSLKRLIDLVERFGLVARLRILPREEIARVDLFCDKNRGISIVADLIENGWSPAGDYLDMPDGMYGFSFTHADKSLERLYATRELLERHDSHKIPKNLNWDSFDLKLASKAL